MKILYGIQTTGNGHLSRAREIIPYLLNRLQVDVILSGPKNQLRIDFPIQKHYRGFTFYYRRKGPSIGGKRFLKITLFNLLLM